MSPFQILLALRVMEVVVTTGAIRCAKLQSNHYLQQTNTQFFTGRMPFLWPNQQWQCTFIHVRSTARHNFSRCTGVIILCILFLRQHILTTCKQIHSSHGSVVNVTDSSRRKPSCNSCWQWWHWERSGQSCCGALQKYCFTCGHIRAFKMTHCTM